MKKSNNFLAIAFIAATTAMTASAQTLLSTLTNAAGEFNDASGVTTLNGDYIMDQRVYVTDGHELFIEAGTVIKAQSKPTPEEACALVVCRGGKIYAMGSETDPIIFTHVDDPNDGSFSILNKELWGGVIILGKAYNNILKGDYNPEEPSAYLGVADGVGYIEGLPYPDDRHHYGAADFNIVGGDTIPVFDNEDNSGVLKYVSIRHGGTDIGEANEINGLTLGSVGSGTTIEHIEIVSNGDDGIEFFGGSVNIKYVNVMFCEDDYIDWDQGYSGKGQFIFGLQLPMSDVLSGGAKVDSVQRGNHGLETDGDDGEDVAREYMSDPTFYNITICGSAGKWKYDSDAAVWKFKKNKGLELKERTLGEIGNSIFCQFGEALDIEQDGEDKGQAGIDYPGGLELYGNLFLNTGNYNSSVLANATQLGELNANGNVLLTSTEVIDCSIEYVSNEGVDQFNDRFNPVPAIGNANVSTTYKPDFSDGFFDYAPYKGAFAPGKRTWLTDWTLHAIKGTGILECATDIDGNGTTNSSDYNAVVGAYGSDCQ